MKNIYYWCPFIGNVATVKAVVNSAYSLVKYSNKKFVPTVINSCGEWDRFNSEFIEKKINSKKFENFFKIDTKTSGYLKSRLTYIKIFLSCFFSLKNLLKKDQPEYLIAHLITSLPIFLYLFFNFKTKLIIRVSGKVKMNFFRKLLWKLSKKNITFITCPTQESKNDFIDLKLVDQSKIIFLPDPIIEINEILIKKKRNIDDIKMTKNFFVMIGRYTRQKNHLLGIRSFKEVLKEKNNLSLLIIGNGELKNEYIKEINFLKLEKNIQLIDYQENIPSYLSKSLGLISTSLWEDPGFVMIEAAACNTFVISSDCPSGPKEFIGTKNGLLFENNNSIQLKKKLIEYLNMDDKKIMKMKIGAKKDSINFTKLRHYKILVKHLS